MILTALITLLLSAPVEARTLRFSGIDWEVKNGPAMGPGPNRWTDDARSVWLDKHGRLHLKLTSRGGVWTCAEVFTKRPTSHGLHRFRVVGRPKDWDPAVVFGAFLYQSDTEEIDIEFARWGNAADPDDAQFVVQPYDRPGNTRRFNLGSSPESVLEIDWREDGVAFLSRGDSRSNPIAWRREGKVPGLTAPRVHLNLWLFKGKPPADGREAEIIIASVEIP